MAASRDDLEVGGTCFLRVGYAGPNGSSKLNRCQVVDVMRAAARVRLLDSGRELTCRFNQLEPDHDYLMEREEREERRRERVREPIAPPPPSPPATTPTPGLKLVPPSAPPPQPGPPKSEFDSWVEMARDVIGPIDAEAQALRMTKEALEAERIALDDQLAALGKQLVELDRRRATLTKFLKEAGHASP